MKPFIQKLIRLVRQTVQTHQMTQKKPALKNQAHTGDEPIDTQTYFNLARHWADDFYTQAVLERNRWRAIALFVLLPLSGLLLLCVTLLIPAQHLEPILINHYENGQVLVEPLKKNSLPKRQAEIESELVRYVVNRESYNAHFYNEQYQLVNVLSSNQVAKHYMDEQNTGNKNSPINTLGSSGTRSVHVQSVVFLDDEGNTQASGSLHTHHNLAQVNFTVTQHDNASGKEASVPLTALIAWAYRGTPNDPEALWKNWDGFTVTSYTVQQRSV